MHEAHVDRRGAVGQGDAPVARVLNNLKGVRVLEQRLGWYTSPDQASSAEWLLLFDDGHLLPELRRTNRRHIATGTRTDDDDIIWVRHCGLQRFAGSPPRTPARWGASELSGTKPLHPYTKLALLILQLPVHFRQLREPPRGPTRLTPGHERNHQRCARDEPKKGHNGESFSPLGTLSSAIQKCQGARYTRDPHV